MMRNASIRYKLYFLIADISGVFIGSSLYDIFFVNNGFISVILLTGIMTFAWYCFMLYLPLQIVFYLVGTAKSHIPFFENPIARLYLFVIHSIFTFAAWIIGGENLLELPLFQIGWFSVLATNLIACYFILKHQKSEDGKY